MPACDRREDVKKNELVSHKGHQIVDQRSRLVVRQAGKSPLRLLSSIEWTMLKPWRVWRGAVDSAHLDRVAGRNGAVWPSPPRAKKVIEASTDPLDVGGETRCASCCLI